MKKVFTSILTLFTLPLLAQVTINQGNFPTDVAYTDDYTVGAAAGVAAPTVGANQTWDYSTLVESSTVARLIVDASGQANFPDGKSYFEENLSFQGFDIPSNTYINIDANGYYEYGRAISDITHSITPITGGPNDVLNFPANDHVYQFDGGRPDYVSFPATYQSSWTGTRIEPVDFNLTVVAFGLNNTPGQQVKHWTETREVVGYGSLTIPLSNGDPSAPMEVLLLEASVSVIDSFFLGGSQAPTPLLDAFGVTQGQISTASYFLFYTPDFHSPVIRFGMDGSTVSSLAYRPAAGSTATGIASAAFENVAMYPNPVVAGTSLSISLGEAAEAVSAIELMDVTGRSVAYQNLQASSSANARLDIPSTLVPGVYSVMLKNADATPLKTTRIVVQ